MTHLRCEFSGSKGTMITNIYSHLRQSHNCSNREAYPTTHFNQQAVWQWLLISEGAMLSRLGWKLSPSSYGMLQVGRTVWSEYLRALRHMARTTVKEQEGTKELINFLDKGTEDVPCGPTILILCCCCQQPAFSVSPGHLTTETNTNRTLLEVQHDWGNYWGKRSQNSNCLLFYCVLICELGGMFSTWSSCIRPVRMSFSLKACYVKTL